MKNPATCYSKDDFNDFTDYIYNRCIRGMETIVRLRNGMTVSVCWFDEEGDDYAGFRSVHRDPWLIWNNDGTSITSRDLDIMETAW